MILCGKNVAARPGDFSAQGCECLYQDSGLNGLSQSQERHGEEVSMYILMCRHPAILAPFNG